MSFADASASAVDLALQLLAESTGAGRVYKTDRDYATEADFLIEDRVRAHLANLTPEVGFLGEERGHTGDTRRYWCLDPIDGTTNYSRGLPNYGIALALIEDGLPVIGEIALPAHGERYSVRDGSARLDGRLIAVAETADPADAIVAVGDFATGRDSQRKNAERLATIGRLADRVGRIRMLGSAATDLAWLAAGRIDAVITHSNHPWDLAAGIALVRAAGATVTDHGGRPYALNSPNVLAAAPGLHAALLAAR